MALTLDQKLNLGARIAQTMTGDYSHLALGTFMGRLERLEREIGTLLAVEIGFYLNNVYSTFQGLGEERFAVQRRRYALRVAPKLDAPILQAFILPDDSEEPWGVEAEVEIAGWGLINKVEVKIADRFRRRLTTILEIVRLVYDAAYAWFREEVTRRLLDLDQGCTSALYGHLRPVLASIGKHQIDDYVWFGVFTEDAGHYLPDLRTSYRAIDILSERKYRSRLSPAAHLLELFGTEIPFPKSISRQVLLEGKPADFDLPRVAYATEKPDYAKTEEQVFPGGTITVVPIAALDRACLTCGFPTIYKKDLSRAVERAKPQLAAIFRERTSLALQFINAMKRHAHAFDLAMATEVGIGASRALWPL